MLAFFVKSQHDRFFEGLGCRAGHISDRLAMRDSPESRSAQRKSSLASDSPYSPSISYFSPIYRDKYHRIIMIVILVSLKRSIPFSRPRH